MMEGPILFQFLSNFFGFYILSIRVTWHENVSQVALFCVSFGFNDQTEKNTAKKTAIEVNSLEHHDMGYSVR